jgi:hypothetical protein
LGHIPINFWILFAIVPSIFAHETFAHSKGKEFSVELMKGHIKWTEVLLFKD